MKLAQKVKTNRDYVKEYREEVVVGKYTTITKLENINNIRASNKHKNGIYEEKDPYINLMDIYNEIEESSDKSTVLMELMTEIISEVDSLYRKYNFDASFDLSDTYLEASSRLKSALEVDRESMEYLFGKLDGSVIVYKNLSKFAKNEQKIKILFTSKHKDVYVNFLRIVSKTNSYTIKNTKQNEGQLLTAQKLEQVGLVQVIKTEQYSIVKITNRGIYLLKTSSNSIKDNYYYQSKYEIETSNRSIPSYYKYNK